MHRLAVVARRSLVFCEPWMGNGSQHLEATLRPLSSVPTCLGHQEEPLYESPQHFHLLWLPFWGPPWEKLSVLKYLLWSGQAQSRPCPCLPVKRTVYGTLIAEGRPTSHGPGNQVGSVYQEWGLGWGFILEFCQSYSEGKWQFLKITNKWNLKSHLIFTNMSFKTNHSLNFLGRRVKQSAIFVIILYPIISWVDMCRQCLLKK